MAQKAMQKATQEATQKVTRKATQKQKTERAFGAYLDLVDTADWIRKELAGPLDVAGLTIGEFRLLFMLYREGAMTIGDAAGKRGCNRQNLHVLIARVEKWGWVEHKIVEHPPVAMKESRVPKARRGKRRRGRRVGMIQLTQQGEKLIGNVLPKQAKIVKSLMRALHGRQQRKLSELCRKLRKGDIVKFFSEMQHKDPKEDLMVEAV
jgi:DNA-binding MarR family transcriptional regulator